MEKKLEEAEGIVTQDFQSASQKVAKQKQRERLGTKKDISGVCHAWEKWDGNLEIWGPAAAVSGPGHYRFWDDAHGLCREQQERAGNGCGNIPAWENGRDWPVERNFQLHRANNRHPPTRASGNRPTALFQGLNISGQNKCSYP